MKMIPEKIRLYSSYFPDFVKVDNVLEGPELYRDFLKKVGYGSVDGFFSFYNGLVSPDEIIDIEDADPILSELMLFCDDGSGYSYAFKGEHDKVYVVPPTGEDVEVVYDNLIEFIDFRFGP